METHSSAVKGLLLGLTALGFAGSVWAASPPQPLLPGGTVLGSDMNWGSAFSPSSGSIATSGPLSFNNGSFSGTVDSWVYDSGTDGLGSPYTSGYDFVYQIGLNQNSGSVDAFQIGGFKGVGTNVGFYPNTNLSDPSSVVRTADGSSVEWRFLTDTGGADLPAGATSAFMVVYTNATSYGPNPYVVHDSVPAFNGSGILAPIPEPESIAMLITGLGLMGFIARRRKRALGA